MWWYWNGVCVFFLNSFVAWSFVLWDGFGVFFFLFFAGCESAGV